MSYIKQLEAEKKKQKPTLNAFRKALMKLGFKEISPVLEGHDFLGFKVIVAKSKSGERSRCIDVTMEIRHVGYRDGTSVLKPRIKWDKPATTASGSKLYQAFQLTNACPKWDFAFMASRFESQAAATKVLFEFREIEIDTQRDAERFLDSIRKKNGMFRYEGQIRVDWSSRRGFEFDGNNLTKVEITTLVNAAKKLELMNRKKAAR